MDLRESGLMKPPGPDLSDPLQAYGAQLPPARIFDQATDRILSVTATTKDGTTIELTDHVSGARPEWNKPKGIYQIYILSLSHNTGCHRDYIKMTEERSVRLLLEAVYEPHWQHYAADFGKIIAEFISDEPELGNGHLYAKENTLGCGQDLPWGPTLEQQFATE